MVRDCIFLASLWHWVIPFPYLKGTWDFILTFSAVWGCGVSCRCFSLASGQLLTPLCPAIGLTTGTFLSFAAAYFLLQVIYARRSFGISPPKISGPPEFERIFRAQ